MHPGPDADDAVLTVLGSQFGASDVADDFQLRLRCETMHLRHFTDGNLHSWSVDYGCGPRVYTMYSLKSPFVNRFVRVDASNGVLNLGDGAR